MRTGEEFQGLAQVNGAGAGQHSAQQARDQCRAPHTVRDHAMEQGVIGIFGIDVGRVISPDTAAKAAISFSVRVRHSRALDRRSVPRK
jgi:hypothetical protein